ncbi:MAG: DEAD/DEAH box helicase [Peptococcaceae bacterium]|nr:DEAD/DEAH box helicase [Peptococcaceae bacterium]
MSIRDLIYEYTDNKATISQGLAYYQLGKVQHLKINSVDHVPGSTLPYSSTIMADAEVFGEKPFLVMRGENLINFHCTCKEGAEGKTLCKHLVALVRALSEILVPTKSTTDQGAIAELLAYYDPKEGFSPTGDGAGTSLVSLIPTLDFDPYSKFFCLEFHLASPKKSYILKSISDFHNHLLKGETVTYGKHLSFKHCRENFDQPSQFYLNLIDNAFDWLCYGNKSSLDRLPKVGRYLHLSHNQFDQLFDYVAEHGGEIDTHRQDGSTGRIRMVAQTPETSVQIVARSGDEYLLGVVMDDYQILVNSQYSYLYNDKVIMRPSEGYQHLVLPLLRTVRSADNALVLNGEQLTRFMARVAPQIAPYVNLEIDPSLRQSHLPEALTIHLRLDYPQSNTIRGLLQFEYGKARFNPLVASDIPPHLLRDVEKENAFAALLAKYHFSTNEDEWLLAGEDNVYTFLHEGLPEMMPLADIDIENTLSRVRPRRAQAPHLSATVTHGILELSFDEKVYGREVLLEVLKAYRAGKKYIRLTDESYIDIINPEVRAVSELLKDCDVPLENLAEDAPVALPLYRALTLDVFAEMAPTVAFDRREAFRALADDIAHGADRDVPVPKDLQATLRSYQLVGYQWLVHLAELGFGGILADDMGLGKTLQTIAYLLHRYEENPASRAIIVMPTSLIYNWESELKRFAPSLPYRIIVGNRKEREALLTDVPAGIVLLTSYATLRRDAALYEPMTFDTIISDEGQYIKNSYTQNTKSLKSLHGDHHFALTGTPIENSLADLWSIMDFCLPGYLHSWREFRNLYEVPITRYEDKTRLDQLKRQIAPFVLRRVKSDVLTELPDKIDTVLYAELSEEERRIYHTQLALSHKAFIEEIANHPTGQSQVRVLTLLMRLRQVCCSPALFLDGFNKPSSKLKLCLSVTEDRVEAGHQILIFSQFTSVLDMIAPELEKRDIKYLTLTGKTPTRDRMTLVNRFNEEKIPVFLISLKAGGIGLNLTSADTVIHFDPWWNQSVENQATDRTHRIGQKKSVHVIRLITKDTIEEKILKLKEKKQALSDAVITSDEGVISKLTMDDLHDLFALDYTDDPMLAPAPRPTRAPYTIEDKQ